MDPHRDTHFYSSYNRNPRYHYVESIYQHPRNPSSDPFFGVRGSFFSHSNLLDEFFGFPSHPHNQSRFSHSQSEPSIEDVSESTEERTQLPTRIEEAPEEEEEWEISDDWEERKKTTRIKITVDDNNITNDNIDNFESVIIIDSDDEKMDQKQEKEDDLREALRASYLSLTITRNRRKGREYLKILVNIPNGKLVKNSFRREESWEPVKQWISFEMAKDKSISNTQFLLESEFQLSIDSPFTLLTPTDKINDNIDKNQRKLRVIIHRT